MSSSMTVDQAITKAFLHAQRKATPPAVGTPKYNALLGIADSMQKLWASEPGIEWNSLYGTIGLSALVTATDTFVLDSTIDDITQREGDYIRVVNGTQTKPFFIIAPDQLYEYRYRDAAAQIGSTLKFSQAFTAADPLIGGTIYVPSFGFVNDITSGSQTVAVEDPMYLVYMMAAEFVRNDSVRGPQYPNLLNLASQVMDKMKEVNDGQMEAVATPWRPDGQNW